MDSLDDLNEMKKQSENPGDYAKKVWASMKDTLIANQQPSIVGGHPELIRTKSISDVSEISKIADMLARAGHSTIMFLAFRVVVIGTLHPEKFLKEYAPYVATQEAAQDMIDTIGLKVDMRTVEYQFFAFGRLYLVKHLNNIRC